MRKYLLLFILVLFMPGCSKNIIMNVDGMPISNYEYNLTNNETGIRTVFVLSRYYKEYEGKEYIIKPEYLDALSVNRINSAETDRLMLHIKVVNLNKKAYSLHWKVDKPNNGESQGLLYTGKLSRKDYTLNLPVSVSGDYQYSFTLLDAKGNDLFELPIMGYQVKGGVKKQAH